MERTGVLRRPIRRLEGPRQDRVSRAQGARRRRRWAARDGEGGRGGHVGTRRGPRRGRGRGRGTTPRTNDARWSSTPRARTRNSRRWSVSSNPRNIDPAWPSSEADSRCACTKTSGHSRAPRRTPRVEHEPRRGHARTTTSSNPSRCANQTLAG